jgi:PAS domain S-box-containing protein
MDMDGRCTFLNRAGAELLGYSSRAVVGRDVHELLHHSYPDGAPLAREDCAIMRALSMGDTISGRNETLWRAGRKSFPVQVSFRALMDGPELRGAVLSFTDMTETRAAEASLRQALQARDEVLAVVSHDLRNPVSTIFSAASLLLTLNPSPEKRREHLLAVKRSAERVNRLIQDLLDIARLEAGVLTVHPAPFHPDRVVKEVLDGHRGQAEQRGISLTSRVPPGIPRGWGDPHRLIQALTNLVENALRETPEGGEVTVGVDENPTGEGLRFFVRDTGPGITPGDQARLFDRFWQVSRKDKGGAGLGLSIVKGIVDAHEGEVWVESKTGEGSTFWFSLPPDLAGGT